MSQIDGQTNKKIRLNEITWMRTILAVLIVFMHSFACYNYNWSEPQGFVDISTYKWLNRMSFSFTLEAFVFISGFLFAFQRITLKREDGFLKLFSSKCRRLFLPSIIFSLLYFVLFYDYQGFAKFAYSIINGCGHMWFLPMLFWCFIGCWLLEKIPLKDSWKMLFLIAINLLTIFSIPLRLDRTAIFIFYFYGGFLVYKHSDIIKPKYTLPNLRLSWIVFYLSFIVLRPLRDYLICGDNEPIHMQVLLSVSSRACQLIYASLGIIAFYFTAVYYTQKHEISSITIKLSNCCFGIYLIQQFILMLVYYKTNIPVILGPYWLPWFGFIVTILISYFFTVGFLKTKVGRFLIG